MSLMEIRGGIPDIFRATITSTGRYHKFKGTSKYLKVVTDETGVKLYFSEEDWTNDENYIGPHNEWEGPVEASEVWLRGDGADSEVELVAFLRRN